MRTTTKAGIKATYYDQNVWKQTRLLVDVELDAGSTATEVSLYYPAHTLGSYGSPLATYKLDNNGKATIDVTDLVRTYAPYNTSESIYIYSDLAASSSDAIEITTNVIGLIPPDGVVIPYNPLALSIEAFVVPPSKVIAPFTGNTIIVETYGSGYNYSTGRLVAKPSNNTYNLARSMELPAGTTSFEFWHLADYKISTTYLQSHQCDRQYAMVEWVSFTGVTRRHAVEIRKAKSTAAVDYSLLTMDNSYNEIKSREDGFSIYMEGLNAYDYWYYSDMLMSSKVMLSLDGTNYTQVEVTSKSVTIPDGNAFDGKLEIAVNWKRYDAVAM